MGNITERDMKTYIELNKKNNFITELHQELIKERQVINEKNDEIERLNKLLNISEKQVHRFCEEKLTYKHKIDIAVEYIESLKQIEDYGNGISLDSYELTTDETKSLLYLLKGDENNEQ